MFLTRTKNQIFTIQMYIQLLPYEFRKLQHMSLPTLPRVTIESIKSRDHLECIKCLFFDDEMCTLHKVGGEDSKCRRVL